MDASSAMVTPSRRIHPSVENSDMYMWSSTNTWLRSMDRRSRYSGRSWCATVATVACSCATCDFERDGHLVAEAALHAGADGAQKPGRGGRTRRGRRPRLAPCRSVFEHALAQQHQPQREQRIGQRRQLRQHERAPASGGAHDDIPACTAATWTRAPAAAARCGICFRRGLHKSRPPLPERWKRWACRSNMVR